MEFKQLLADDDAVSPVIGVILMVAITVILAAVIGTFVLGLGEQVQDTSPNTQFEFDYEEGNTDTDSFGNADSASDDGLLTATHTSGQSIDAARLRLVGSSAGSGDEEVAADSSNPPQYSAGDDIGAGDSITLRVANDDEIDLIWTSEGGDQSDTLRSWSGPNA